MSKIILVSDARTVLDDLAAVVDDGERTVVELRDGALVREVVRRDPPDLVITDCQVQNMGGLAVCMDLKLEESGGRIPSVPVLVLLDRRADVFLAKRSAAEGWLVKPLDPVRLRRAVDALLAGGTFHDESFRPPTVAAH
ncbi:MAG: putative two-component response regulator [Acidimicrobiaceae bacterium]|nr:putative two-component response regulator [Acidimicrobiaceae bacterium]